MDIQDNEHSDLIEAVAALQMTKPSPIARSNSCSNQAAIDSGGLDSGYASQSSTPKSSKSAFVERPLVSRGRNPLRKAKELKPYQKKIPELTHERFSDLRELYAESLNQFTRGLPNNQGILMSLKVLGEDEVKAEPWVLVQCDKAIFKIVNNFFKQPFIKKEFEPPEPTAVFPRLRVIVCPLAPRQLAKYADVLTQRGSLELGDTIQIFSCGESASSGTLCGTQVMTRLPRGLHKATIGGIIAAADEKGETKLFGMTAGHFLIQNSYSEIQDDLEVSDEEMDTEEETFELDLNSLDGVIEEGSIAGFTELEDNAALSDSSHLGNILTASHACAEDGRNLDWALITIDHPSFILPNMITFYHQQRELKLFPRRETTGFDKKVIVISARGPLWGSLSKNWSYMMLPPGNTLVRTHLLTLLNGETLQSGDSGAWIADDITNELYGHVVADDVFGRGYVVPIHDSLEDIKNRLGVDSVLLPPKIDILAFNLESPATYPTVHQLRDSPPGMSMGAEDTELKLLEWLRHMKAHESAPNTSGIDHASSSHASVTAPQEDRKIVSHPSSPIEDKIGTANRTANGIVNGIANGVYGSYRYQYRLPTSTPSQAVTPFEYGQFESSNSYRTPDSGYASMNPSPGQSPPPLNMSITVDDSSCFPATGHFDQPWKSEGNDIGRSHVPSSSVPPSQSERRSVGNTGTALSTAEQHRSLREFLSKPRALRGLFRSSKVMDEFEEF